MLHKQSFKKNTEGFTIIEVLIVLAIAALILLIVFLAVPALQRSSRNNSIKNDASRISTEVANYASNNNGALPRVDTTAHFDNDCANISTDVGTLSELGDATGALTCGTASATMVAGDIVGTSGVVTALMAPGGANTKYGVMLDEQAACPSTTSTSVTTLAGNGRQSVILYTLETASGAYNIACIQAT